MPTYSITGPDGKDYSIDGPEGATRDQVIAKIKERMAMPQQPESPSLMDYGKDVGQSFARGAAKAFGTAGNVREMLPEWGKEALGFLPGAAGAVARNAPTSEQIGKAVAPVLGEKSTTALGPYAESIGEFAPTAFIGPGGALTKAATTVAGGLGAEAGGEMFGEKGRFVGGLLGGAAAGHAAAETVEAGLRRALKGEAENKAASQAAFKMIQESGVRIDPAATTNFIDNLDQTLQNQFITKAGQAAGIFPAIDKAREGGLAELIDLHSRLGTIKPERGELYTASVIARPEIREFIENLTPDQLRAGAAGSGQNVAALWQHARDTWRIQAKLSEVRQAAESADVRMAATGRGMNWNTFRQEFKKILLSDDKTRGYSEEAVKNLQQIVKGSLVQNLARYGSAIAPRRGPLGGLATAGAFVTGGLEPASAVAAIGEGSHFLEGYLTKRQIWQLEDLIKRESPIQPQQTLPDRSTIAPAAAARSAAASALTPGPLAPGQ